MKEKPQCRRYTVYIKDWTTNKSWFDSRWKRKNCVAHKYHSDSGNFLQGATMPCCKLTSYFYILPSASTCAGIRL